MSADKTRAILTPIVGIYELRLGDAHLPSSTISQAFAMVGIERDAPLVIQGQRMIELTCDALTDIGRSVARVLRDDAGD